MKDLFKNAIILFISSIILQKRCFQLTVHAVENHRYIVPLQINIGLPVNLHDLKLDWPFQSFQVSWSYHANGRYRKLRWNSDADRWIKERNVTSFCKSARLLSFKSRLKLFYTPFILYLGQFLLVSFYTYMYSVVCHTQKTHSPRLKKLPTFSHQMMS